MGVGYGTHRESIRRHDLIPTVLEENEDEMHSPKNLRMVTEEYSTTPVSQRIFSQNLNMTMPIKSFDT